MKNSLEKVLTKLRCKKRKGISFDDFPVGTEVRKRISELKDMGFEIYSQYEVLPTGCRRKRYWLLGEPSVCPKRA